MPHQCMRRGCKNMNQGTLPFCSKKCDDIFYKRGTDSMPQSNQPTALVEACARTAHEVNRVYCQTGLGDPSQPTWEAAPQWQKDSAIQGAAFTLDNPKAGESASHDSWLAEKAKAGWVHGEVKDPIAKTHPCIVPFDELPGEQQAKDALFRATVLGVAAACGWTE